MIRLFKVFMANEVMDELEDILYSGYIGQGKKVDEFEEALEEYVGKNVTMNSATSAIHVALDLAEVRGKDVITTPATCTATNIPILHAGGNIIWADVDPMNGNISLESIKKKITPTTAAIMVVHYGGNICDPRIVDFALENNIKVIEDCAHSLTNGIYGHYACYSFQAIKHITCGDGGTLVCARSDEDYEKAKLLRWYGIDRTTGHSMRCLNNVTMAGYKFHMNDISATIGLTNLKHHKQLHAKTLDNSHRYDVNFYNLKKVIPAKVNLYSDHWLYILIADDAHKFIAYLKDNGIEASQVHADNRHHDIFKEYNCDLPGVDEFYKKQVAIPVGWWLKDCEREYIINKVCLYGRS